MLPIQQYLCMTILLRCDEVTKSSLVVISSKHRNCFIMNGYRSCARQFCYVAKRWLLCKQRKVTHIHVLYIRPFVTKFKIRLDPYILKMLLTVQPELMCTCTCMCCLDHLTLLFQLHSQSVQNWYIINIYIC